MTVQTVHPSCYSKKTASALSPKGLVITDKDYRKLIPILPDGGNYGANRQRQCALCYETKTTKEL